MQVYTQETREENLEESRKKYLLTIQYNGANYNGWQLQKNSQKDSQKNVKTIQGVLEEKINIILKEKTAEKTTKKITLFVAGRTDARVHANGQRAHFETSCQIDKFKFLYSINSLLKDEQIAILDVEEILNADFHARFSCVSKTYKYYIHNSYIRDVFLQNASWRVPQFCTETANKCAQFLIGNHDFSSFRDTMCQAKTAIRTIDALHFEYTRSSLICATICGRSFLHHQIRIMIGTIHQIIAQKKDPSVMMEILEKRNRTYAGPTAPAHGLFLEKVEY